MSTGPCTASGSRLSLAAFASHSTPRAVSRASPPSPHSRPSSSETSAEKRPSLASSAARLLYRASVLVPVACSTFESERLSSCMPPRALTAGSSRHDARLISCQYCSQPLRSRRSRPYGSPSSADDGSTLYACCQSARPYRCPSSCARPPLGSVTRCSVTSGSRMGISSRLISVTPNQRSQPKTSASSCTSPPRPASSTATPPLSAAGVPSKSGAVARCRLSLSLTACSLKWRTKTRAAAALAPRSTSRCCISSYAVSSPDEEPRRWRGLSVPGAGRAVEAGAASAGCSAVTAAWSASSSMRSVTSCSMALAWCSSVRVSLSDSVTSTENASRRVPCPERSSTSSCRARRGSWQSSCAEAMAKARLRCPVSPGCFCSASRRPCSERYSSSRGRLSSKVSPMVGSCTSTCHGGVSMAAASSRGLRGAAAPSGGCGAAATATSCTLIRVHAPSLATQSSKSLRPRTAPSSGRRTRLGTVLQEKRTPQPVSVRCIRCFRAGSSHVYGYDAPAGTTPTTETPVCLKRSSCLVSFCTMIGALPASSSRTCSTNVGRPGSWCSERRGNSLRPVSRLRSRMLSSAPPARGPVPWLSMGIRPDHSSPRSGRRKQRCRGRWASCQWSGTSRRSAAKGATST